MPNRISKGRKKFLTSIEVQTSTLNSPQTISNENSVDEGAAVSGEVELMIHKPVHQRAQVQQNYDRLKKIMNDEQKALASSKNKAQIVNRA